MSRPEALTDSQKHQLRRLKFTRRELVRQLKSLPSIAELAQLFDVSERTIGRHMSEREPVKIRLRLVTLRDMHK
jgi:DNA-binding transcriptional ArsR family regulator